MEGEILRYRIGGDEDTVENDLSIDPPRKRGKMLPWSIVCVHENLQAATQSMLSHNVPVITRLKGRNNRGKTASYYYHCIKVSCGCTMQWRLVTALDSLLVTEEVTSGGHVSHDNFRRNGGRGLSTEQVTIVDEAFRLGIKKPKFVLKYFEDKAIQNPTAGEFYYSTDTASDFQTKPFFPFFLFEC